VFVVFYYSESACHENDDAIVEQRCKSKKLICIESTSKVL
jgi:hypothetical protein